MGRWRTDGITAFARCRQLCRWINRKCNDSRRVVLRNISKILVVAMPITPEMDDLDVADEVSAVRSLHISPRVAVEFLEYPQAIDVV
jgi:hypothetical protein